ncbi:hypothetical protein FNV43_RR06583 [Rhamnella rubrinervis]|uniref:PGG domain-containing protein n=1 Tax=Rhamnella rubrinervis TaxID=2594499 RepID=A0A8K0MLJ1_9ROSA|nr:hypothetical protein FNV43_RR06583 [Rhamnella rubrinervis]
MWPTAKVGIFSVSNQILQDLAFVIAKKYPNLLVEKDGAGKIGLQLLSNNPLAFRSGKSYGWLKNFIFKHCIPTFEEDEKEEGYEEEDLKDRYEVDLFDHEDPDNSKRKGIRFTYVCNCMPINVASALRKINISIWKFLRGRYPMMKRMYDEHRKDESALRLAKFLIKRDMTWEVNLSQENKDKISLVAEDEGDRNIGEYEEAATKMGRLADWLVKEHKGKISLGAADEEGDGEKGEYEEAAEKLARLFNKLLDPTWKDNLSQKDEGQSTVEPVPGEVVESLPSPPTSLLVATTNGIVEIVEEILKVFPQAVEHVSDAGQNILHIAIKHRQLEIFHLVTKQMALSKSRLVRRIDNNGYTLLHQAGVMRYYTGTLPGPAFQLQEELWWFERVRNLIPSHYERHCSIKWKETAEVFFHRQHKDLLKEAQDWLKRTSESCSTVAVLIATVAFAAAYTIPGGSNPETGVPILLHDAFFLVFTVMDVLSLASSLTSVVMFLSILTSPFELQDFHRSLPRKLTLGFIFLFFSVAATMLAFAATIVLTVHLKKRWITTLIYSLAFLPVSVFALLQFPLYIALKNSIKYSWELIRTNRH